MCYSDALLHHRVLQVGQRLLRPSISPELHDLTFLPSGWLQALAGQLRDAEVLWGNWSAVWNHFKGLPEQFSPSNMAQHPSMHVRPPPLYC